MFCWHESFLEEVVELWDEFKNSFMVDSLNINEQPFLLSSFFQRGNAAIWNKRLYESGCRYVGDLMSQEGQIMAYEDLTATFRIDIPRLEFLGIIRAIKKTYSGQMPARSVGPTMQPALECALMPTSGCGHYYRTLITGRYGSERPQLKSEIKWNIELGNTFDWCQLYKRAHISIKDTALVWFQDKILHRILTTNTFVAKFTSSTELCTFCDDERETLLHLFVTCPKVRIVWEHVECRIEDKLGIKVMLGKADIIVGLDDRYQMSLEDMNGVQRLILLAKYYIYRTKAAKGLLSSVSLNNYCRCHTYAEWRYKQTDKERKQYEVHRKLCE